MRVRPPQTGDLGTNKVIGRYLGSIGHEITPAARKDTPQHDWTEVVPIGKGEITKALDQFVPFLSNR
jgi:hypothetical protein